MEQSHIRVPAKAKLNLYLHVTGRRQDGYHFLDSLVTFAEIHDQLTASAAANLTVDCDGPFAACLPEVSKNLVLRAATALMAASDVTKGASIRLTKNLPVASGIGGGSADAAATLKALTQLWEIPPGAVDLPGIALRLGADVPICLHGRTALVRGVGGVLEPTAPLPLVHLVLVNPCLAVSTAAVFAARDAPFSAQANFDELPGDAAGLAHWLEDGTDNDLTVPAIALEPVIRTVVTALRATQGCLLARMSGSGATCFGLYEMAEDSERAASEITRDHASWWVCKTQIVN